MNQPALDSSQPVSDELSTSNADLNYVVMTNGKLLSFPPIDSLNLAERDYLLHSIVGSRDASTVVSSAHMPDFDDTTLTIELEHPTRGVQLHQRAPGPDGRSLMTRRYYDGSRMELDEVVHGTLVARIIDEQGNRTIYDQRAQTVRFEDEENGRITERWADGSVLVDGEQSEAPENFHPVIVQRPVSSTVIWSEPSSNGMLGLDRLPGIRNMIGDNHSRSMIGQRYLYPDGIQADVGNQFELTERVLKPNGDEVPLDTVFWVEDLSSPETFRYARGTPISNDHFTDWPGSAGAADIPDFNHQYRGQHRAVAVQEMRGGLTVVRFAGGVELGVGSAPPTFSLQAQRLRQDEITITRPESGRGFMYREETPYGPLGSISLEHGGDELGWSVIFENGNYRHVTRQDGYEQVTAGDDFNVVRNPQDRFRWQSFTPDLEISQEPASPAIDSDSRAAITDALPPQATPTPIVQSTIIDVSETENAHTTDPDYQAVVEGTPAEDIYRYAPALSQGNAARRTPPTPQEQMREIEARVSDLRSQERALLERWQRLQGQVHPVPAGEWNEHSKWYRDQASPSDVTELEVNTSTDGPSVIQQVQPFDEGQDQALWRDYERRTLNISQPKYGFGISSVAWGDPDFASRVVDLGGITVSHEDLEGAARVYAYKEWTVNGDERSEYVNLMVTPNIHAASAMRKALSEMVVSYGLEPAMRRAEELSQDFGYLDPERSDGRMFELGPRDSFQTQREADQGVPRAHREFDNDYCYLSASELYHSFEARNPKSYQPPEAAMKPEPNGAKYWFSASSGISFGATTAAEVGVHINKEWDGSTYPPTERDTYPQVSRQVQAFDPTDPDVFRKATALADELNKLRLEQGLNKATTHAEELMIKSGSHGWVYDPEHPEDDPDFAEYRFLPGGPPNPFTTPMESRALTLDFARALNQGFEDTSEAVTEPPYPDEIDEEDEIWFDDSDFDIPF